MIKQLLTKLIRGYQYFISPLFPSRCRFYPTCSEYAIEAIALHGSSKGGWLALKRISKCHPFGSSGYDPVPGSENGETENTESANKSQTGCGCKCGNEEIKG